MIEIQNLKKNYGSFQALKGISLSIKSGEILGLLGPNGAGKTTTMKIIMGFLQASSGSVEINGMNVNDNAFEIQKKIGYLPESTPLYQDLNVYEHLEFTAQVHNISKDEQEEAIKKAAQMCGILERLYFNISELSKGYKQRVGLAQALIHNPEILILDEPTTGLDPNQIIEIRDLIKSISKEKTIILSTHIMQEVEATCDRVIVLKNGEILAQGTPDELMGSLSGMQTIKITLKGTKKNIDTILKMKSIENAKEVQNAKRGIYTFVITSKKDIRNELLKNILKEKIDLLELSAKAHSMEEVFQELTS